MKGTPESLSFFKKSTYITFLIAKLKYVVMETLGYTKIEEESLQISKSGFSRRGVAHLEHVYKAGDEFQLCCDRRVFFSYGM